jgi:radical SAM protein with 4Fe4S-binding SPASM domain
MKMDGAWLTTNRECNLRCPWCYAKGTRYPAKQEMSFGLAKLLSGIIKGLELKHLILIGGEPTLWKPLFEYNDFCRQEGMSSTIVTNGLKFAEDEFFAQYQKNPCKFLSISVKGVPEQYQKFGLRTDVSRVKKALSRIAENYNEVVCLTFNSLYRENLPKIAKFVAECGFKTLAISFCTPSFKGLVISGKFITHPHETAKIIANSYQEMRKYLEIHFNMNFPLCVWPEDFLKRIREEQLINTGCHVKTGGGAIFDINGDSVMCNGLFDYPIAVYGKDFWDADSYLKFRQKEEVKALYDRIINFPSEKCRDCDMYIDCGGGCPLLWFFYKPNDIIENRR